MIFISVLSFIIMTLGYEVVKVLYMDMANVNKDFIIIKRKMPYPFKWIQLNGNVKVG